VGYDHSGSYISSFWNTTVDDSCLSGVGNRNPDPNGVIGETAANMQIQSTFTDEGWDFVGEDVHGTDNTWRMCIDGINYPKFSLEFLAGDIACPDGVEMNDLMYLVDYWLEEDCFGAPGCLTADINAEIVWVIPAIDASGGVAVADTTVLIVSCQAAEIVRVIPAADTAGSITVSNTAVATIPHQTTEMYR